MPIRNPFRRAPEATEEAQRSANDNEFKNTAVSGAQSLQIKDPAEYKLSGELARVLLQIAHVKDIHEGGRLLQD